MKRILKIRDLTLRDGQQSQFATRMSQAQVDKVLPYYKEAHFYAMEVWGGAVPDSVMRYLNESPWDRLESIKRGVGESSKLTALSRGRNLFGYNPYPDSVIEGFCKNAVASGIDIMRIFDALNDIDNMKSSIRFVKEAGGLADCAVCYTVDPKFSGGEKLRAFLSGKKLPSDIFNIRYFVEKAKALEALGADMITIKDMAGLIDPHRSASLIKALKSEVGVPIDLHTHCTPGYGVASILAAMVNGADIVDTAILSFSGGPAAPGAEAIGVQTTPIARGPVETRPLPGAGAAIPAPSNGAPGNLLKTEPKALKQPYSEAALAQMRSSAPASAEPMPPIASVAPSAATTRAPATEAATASAAPAAAAPSGAGASDWIWPASGQVVQDFAQPSSMGISISGKPGDPIVAVNDGRVIFSGAGPRSYGNLVIVKHGDDTLSVYAHNRTLLVKEGQSVKRGQRIAELGSSGTDAPRLHFEIRRDGRPIDPRKVLPAR